MVKENEEKDGYSVFRSTVITIFLSLELYTTKEHALNPHGVINVMRCHTGHMYENISYVQNKV